MTEGPAAYLLDSDVRILFVLRAIRAQRGLSQIDVATATGLSLSTVGRIEAGTSGLSAERLRELLHCYGYRLAALSVASTALPDIR